ncbi:Bacteroides conjugative transposon TraJ protein [Chitinophaga jiangningensis]|uniref:Bacteroides conjugative transposon TraJ protein n=2 Tax=Chitinophaga jiangningensis TaxID=1419482 RepID=A0A1M7A3U3_9BACT|nr:Bacteroides conjugative transposon TraJ protein [Chitinophaga jiangningensis]
MLVAACMVPILSMAQTGNSEAASLRDILKGVYDDMIPLADKIITVARAIGLFGALLYIGVRVGKSIATAESIDFFSLLRPFVLILLIGIYPQFIAVINGILEPATQATAALVQNSDEAVKNLLDAELKMKTDAQYGPLPPPDGVDIEDWHIAMDAQSEVENGFWNFLWGKMEGTITYYIKLAIAKILQILFFAAALVIDALRTFHLIILVILGPFVLALSIYDGFQHTLSVWLARYVSIYLWLAVANLCGAVISHIQKGMIQADIDSLSTGTNNAQYQITSLTYLIFLIIGIMCYLVVPSISSYIVHASGGNALMTKLTKMAGGVVSGGAGVMATSAAGSMVADMPGRDIMNYPMADAVNSEKYIKDKISG